MSDLVGIQLTCMFYPESMFSKWSVCIFCTDRDGSPVIRSVCTVARQNDWHWTGLEIAKNSLQVVQGLYVMLYHSKFAWIISVRVFCIQIFVRTSTLHAGFIFHNLQKKKYTLFYIFCLLWRQSHKNMYVKHKHFVLSSVIFKYFLDTF